MKAEHRKELHTNLLADRMGKLLQSVKAGPSPNAWVIWIGLGLIVLTVIAWRVYSSRSLESRSDLWVKIDEALHDETGMQSKLGDLAAANKGTLPGRVARFQLARRHLQEGVRTLPADAFRTEAVDKLKKARDEFTQLAGEFADDPILGPEALMNRARAEEALAGVPDPADAANALGDLHRARAAYEQLLNKYPDSAPAQVAKERVKIYADEEQFKMLQQFYARLRDDFRPRSPTPDVFPPKAPTPGN